MGYHQWFHANSLFTNEVYPLTISDTEASQMPNASETTGSIGLLSPKDLSNRARHEGEYFHQICRYPFSNFVIPI